jgi:DNA primase
MSDFIVGILEEFLGDSRKHDEINGQVQFDCPACAEEKGLPNGDGKGNLEVNYHQGVFKCWACKDHNNMSGYIPKLISRYGNSKLLKQYYILKPDYKTDYSKNNEKRNIEVKLPDSFLSLKDKYPYDPAYNDAMRYLKERGITQNIIDYYGLGYTSSGKHFLRIVMPSYDIDDNLNYFVARAFSWVKPKYKNHENDKTLVIINENKINWDATIYLVEGPFDHIVTPNSIPLLGKYISDLLLETLIEKSSADIIIVLDPDAIKDAIVLYKQLRYIEKLKDRVKIVFLPEDYDIALIHEECGPKGVLNWLRTAKKLSLKDLKDY